MFTKSELQSIIQTTQSLQLGPSSLQIIPTKSGGGVCSRKYLEDGLKKFIEDSEGRISFNELSKSLDVEDRYIAQILSGIPEDEWGINGRQIVPKKPFAVLENDLRGELLYGVVTVIRYCREKDIQIEFLKKLLEYLKVEWSTEVFWLDGERYIYSEMYFDNTVDTVRCELEEATKPIEFKDLRSIKSSSYPAEFVQRVLVTVSTEEELDGIWTAGTFVPGPYKLKQQDEAVEQLKSQGFIAQKVLKRAYVDKPDSFLAEKLPNFTTLSSYYVTTEWLDGIEKDAIRSIEDAGFVNLSDFAYKLPEGAQVHVREWFRKRQTRKLIDHAGCFLTPELVERMQKDSFAYVNEEAEKAWTTAVNTNKAIYPVTIYWRELRDWLITRYPDVPLSAIDSFGKAIMPKASARYSEREQELRDTTTAAAKEHFLDKIYLRFVVNVTAVNRVQDSGLRDKLAQDLVAYYQRIITEGLTKLLDRVGDWKSQRKNERVEDAITSINGVFRPEEPIRAVDALEAVQTELNALIKSTFTEEPSDEMIETKQLEMQRELKSQLEKATDASLMMLVVLILLFSEVEDGILRATGKYAPKLLKLLKPKMPESDYEFLSSVKAAVIAKSTLSGDDIDRLRQIGLVCGTS
ncbi:hypothetical protein ABW19_dt0207738 [Dactylella cylindrospora]|nr:hypothetical protein ABW19_dt0207738 [Dactylella cylindrospora]